MTRLPIQDLVRCAACVLAWGIAGAAQASDAAPAAAPAPVVAPVSMPAAVIPAPIAAVPEGAGAPAAAAALVAPAAPSAPTPPAEAPRPRLPTASASTRQALEALLGALPDTPEAGQRPRVAARRGETLDALIRRTLPDSPLKESFLRGVMLELNASAFQPGTTRLLPNAQLVLPTTADLRMHLQRVLGVKAPDAAADAVSPAQERRRWVRFP